MPRNASFPRTCDLLVSQKTMQRHFSSTFHPLSPVIFATATVMAFVPLSQFQVQLPLLYTAWSNAYPEIGPEVTLRPLATSCTKDYKGHSRVQTSFTEPPNISCLFWMRLADLWDRWLNRSSYQLFILPLLQRLLFPRKSEQPSLPHQSHNVYWYLSACTLHPQNDDDQIKGGKKKKKNQCQCPVCCDCTAEACHPAITRCPLTRFLCFLVQLNEV